MFVPDSKVKEYCRYYSDDSTVRRNLAFECGFYVPLHRIAKVRKTLHLLKAAHLGHATTCQPPAHENATEQRERMAKASRALLTAIVREHGYMFKKMADSQARRV